MVTQSSDSSLLTRNRVPILSWSLSSPDVIVMKNMIYKHICFFDIGCRDWTGIKKFVALPSDSLVGIATGYGLDCRGVGVRVPVGSRIFFSTSSRPGLGSIQPPIQWVPEALSQGVKRPVHGADDSPPASAEVKKTCISTSTPIRLYGVVLN
jgi:hypothetical protein